MKSYYDKVKANAVDVLAAAIGEPVANCRDGIHSALSYALREGSYSTAATAIMAAGRWCWAHAETEEEQYKCEMGLKDCTHEDQHGEADKAEKLEHEKVVEAVDKAADKVVEAVTAANA
jgi:hypothetical protein